MLWSLVSGGCEIRITQSTAATLYPDQLLPVLQNFRFDFPGFLIPGDRAQGHFNDDVLSEPAGAIVATAILSILRKDIFIITQVQQGPEIFISPQNNMTASAAVTSIRSRERIELGTHKMFAASTAVATFAINPYLIYKI